MKRALAHRPNNFKVTLCGCIDLVQAGVGDFHSLAIWCHWFKFPSIVQLMFRTSRVCSSYRRIIANCIFVSCMCVSQDMTGDQLMAEKKNIQKCLLQYEAQFGRPVRHLPLLQRLLHLQQLSYTQSKPSSVCEKTVFRV